MNNLIQEEIKRINLLSKYDNSKTLGEQNVNPQYQAALNAAKPKTPEQSIANDLYWAGAGRLGTDEDKILNTIKKIQSPQQYNQVNKDFMAKAKQSIVSMINSEFGDGDAKVVSDIINHLKSKGINVTSKSAESGKNGLGGGYFQSDLKMNNPTLSTSVDNVKGQDSVKNKTIKTKQKTTPPPVQLKDADGIKSFQDWLDTNTPGWATGYKGGIINKGQNGGGYGSYGPRTQKAWNTYKDKYLQNSGPQTLDSKQAPTLSTQTQGAEQAQAPVNQQTTVTSGQVPTNQPEITVQGNTQSAVTTAQPNNGAIYGQQYTASDGKTYVWDGTKYNAK
jgi:hypothetical protein